MIAVIADDLTGAAELGGIGLRYNLRVEIDTEVNLLSDADLLVIATDTRSKSKQQAEADITKITQELLQLKPDLIFKKIDSVLRGHVVPEINAQLSILDLNRALVVPANPTLGRTIVNETYFFNGKPIHESSFSHDPEFAIKSSKIVDMVKAPGTTVLVQKHQEPLSASGIVVGEVQHTDDLNAWAKKLDDNTLVVGASGFFTAILDERNISSATGPEATRADFGNPALYICGTTFSKSRQLIRNEKDKGGPVSYMPAALIAAQPPTEEQYDAWSKEIVAHIRIHGRAIIAIDPATTEGIQTSAAALRTRMAKAIEKVFQQVTLQEIVMEGGSTASAVLSQLGLHRFYPVEEAALGVIRMKVEGKDKLYLTMKPGSYTWPSSIWRFGNETVKVEE